jgi:hypothetical protein
MIAADSPLQFYGAKDFAERPPAATPWLWENFLARGMVSLLTSRWKTGKTTLLSILIQRLSTGEPLAGEAVTRGKAVIFTEEPFSLWQGRNARLGFGPNVKWCSRPFRRRPTPGEWSGLIRGLTEAKPDLVVFDPLAMILPGALENTATGLLDALEPLHHATNAGIALLLIHHPKKGPPSQELSPRGTGALTGFADILIDLERPLHPHFSDRVRRLSVASRLTGSLRRHIELTPDGRDYLVLPNPPDRDGFDAGWPLLRMMLEDASNPPTRLELLEDWPQDYDTPSRTTLGRWLSQATEQNLVDRHGTGRHHNPYRYWLKGKELGDRLPPMEVMEP